MPERDPELRAAIAHMREHHPYGHPRQPPGVAYWWPAILFAASLICLIAMIAVSFTPWYHAQGALKITAGACLGGAFALCPVRDWLLDRRWPDRD